MIKKMVILRWECRSRHRHRSLEAAEQCERLTNLRRRRIPDGYITRYAARQMFWNIGAQCAASDLSKLAMDGVIRYERGGAHKRSAWWLNENDVKALVSVQPQGKPVLLGDRR